MSVTDTQAALLKAQLRGDAEEVQRLVSGMDQDADQRAYNTLLAAAFLEAVERRFGTTTDRASVIEFVGDLRARSEGIGEKLSPEVAERLLLHALDVGSIDELDDDTVVRGQMFITTGLVGDEQMSDEQLDAFIAEVRAMADRFL